MKNIYFTEFQGSLTFLSTSKELFEDHKKVVKANRQYYLSIGYPKEEFEETDKETKEYVMSPDEFYDYLKDKDKYYLEKLGYNEVVE